MYFRHRSEGSPDKMSLSHFIKVYIK